MNPDFHRCIQEANSYESLGNYAASIPLYQNAIQIASTDIDLREHLPDLYTKLGNMLDYLGIFDKAKKNFENALKIAIETKNKSGESASYINLAILHHHNSDYSQALSFLGKSLLIGLKINNEKRIVQTYLAYANLYDDLGQYSQAKEYTLKIFDTILSHIFEYDNRFIAIIHKILASIYFSLTDYEASKCYLEVAEKLELISPNENSLAITRMDLASVHVAQKNYDLALPFFRKAFSMFQNLKNRIEEGYCHLNLGIANTELGLPEAKKNLEDALQAGQDI
jgi:tetratricopeptide (TPR) repeat protein